MKLISFYNLFSKCQNKTQKQFEVKTILFKVFFILWKTFNFFPRRIFAIWKKMRNSSIFNLTGSISFIDFFPFYCFFFLLSLLTFWYSQLEKAIC